ncbi:hypothetical protein EAX61_04815 [Dokdonia sinensis]|uniref:Lysine transporter LysE n=1 Tax=Dokdonia sinensis TaxID=2479847 RepID=A0A3M0GNV5_9FLAO|nr:LysE family transporter [Dokdonia sinensis]RMB62899.1 hypothetical protein EAX61_04815 [Dokdonia sinensis]
MIFSLFIAVFATFIGALPPGASNLAVVKTTAEESIQESLKITYGAATGEVLVAIIALSFGMMVQSFYDKNLWLQISFSAVMGAFGLYFIFKKQRKETKTKPNKKKFLRGFIFGAINPPVLIYWMVLFSISSSYSSIHEGSPWFILLFFFTGVFLGKTVALYGYALLSRFIIQKNGHFKSMLNNIIGIVLVILALLQGSKLLFF